MDPLAQISAMIAVTMGAAWASGINFYAAVLVLGLLGTTDLANLPPGLEILMNPLVLSAAGIMYLVEFFTDKIPGVDSLWDALHTFVRIPGGALLAAGAYTEMGPAVTLAAAMVGGGLAATAHAAKAGTRIMINTSPEPISNWVASVTEDMVVVGGLWAALFHPLLFFFCLVLFLILLIWLLPRLWRHGKNAFSSWPKVFQASSGKRLPGRKHL
ncbi:MAG: DUF4126 domain-containing protein [bacterium]|nr:DUF4126 domain-containing protein [bacterium]